jgi:hypothetical protein
VPKRPCPGLLSAQYYKSLLMHTYTWKKYLPIIRILLKRSVSSEQVFTVNRIDFEKAGHSRKNPCSFTMEFALGKTSPLYITGPAKELSDVLLEDETAKSLLVNNKYLVVFTNNFELRIKNISHLEEAQVEPSGAISS